MTWKRGNRVSCVSYLLSELKVALSARVTGKGLHASESKQPQLEAVSCQTDLEHEAVEPRTKTEQSVRWLFVV